MSSMLLYSTGAAGNDELLSAGRIPELGESLETRYSLSGIWLPDGRKV